MDYNTDDIDKIVEFKTWTPRQKTDELLRIDASLYCNLGSDSKKKERAEVKKQSRTIYRAIKKVNPEMGTTFLNCLDNDAN